MLGHRLSAEAVATVLRLREPHGPVKRSDQERPLACLRQPIPLARKDARRGAVAGRRKQLREHAPQLDHAGDLLKRDPARPDREREPQRLDRQ
jgi:hypothetical protein